MAKKMWYVDHPIHQYNEDVKALARESGLQIIDSIYDDGNGEKDTPKLTKKSAKAAAKVEKQPTKAAAKVKAKALDK